MRTSVQPLRMKFTNESFSTLWNTIFAPRNIMYSYVKNITRKLIVFHIKIGQYLRKSNFRKYRSFRRSTNILILVTFTFSVWISNSNTVLSYLLIIELQQLILYPVKSYSTLVNNIPFCRWWCPWKLKQKLNNIVN